MPSLSAYLLAGVSLSLDVAYLPQHHTHGSSANKIRIDRVPEELWEEVCDIV